MNRRQDAEADGRQDEEADPFAPPGEEADDSTFELAQDSGPHVSGASQDGQSPSLPTRVAPPGRRKPVAYKSPPGGVGNFVLWAFAGLGALAAVWMGVRFFMGAAKDAPAVAAVARPAAAPAKQVAWKAVETGDAVLVQVDAPRNVRLLLDGEPLPSNPVRLVRGSVHTIAAVGERGERASVKVTADAPKTVKLKLGRPRK